MMRDVAEAGVAEKNGESDNTTTTTTTTTIPPSKKAKTSSSPNNNNVVVRVGVGVVVQDPCARNKVFCGIRKGSHGAGTLSLPGGHLELYESWEDCAIREVQEEMNIELEPQSMKLCYVSNDPMPNENKHYVTIFMMGKQQRQEEEEEEEEEEEGKEEEYPKPVNMEPDKCEGWDSYTIDELKEMDSSKLFGPLKRLLQANPSSLHDFLKS